MQLQALELLGALHDGKTKVKGPFLERTLMLHQKRETALKPGVLQALLCLLI
jgi:hypothetical protein